MRYLINIYNQKIIMLKKSLYTDDIRSFNNHDENLFRYNLDF